MHTVYPVTGMLSGGGISGDFRGQNNFYKLFFDPVTTVNLGLTEDRRRGDENK